MFVIARLIELVALFLTLTQVIIPSIMGRPFFPSFRREAKILHDIAQQEQALTEAALEEKLKSLKEKQEKHV